MHGWSLAVDLFSIKIPNSGRLDMNFNSGRSDIARQQQGRPCVSEMNKTRRAVWTWDVLAHVKDGGFSDPNRTSEQRLPRRSGPEQFKGKRRINMS